MLLHNLILGQLRRCEYYMYHVYPFVELTVAHQSVIQRVIETVKSVSRRRLPRVNEVGDLARWMPV